uniref:Ankyrin repeat protein n=1 Tax=Neobodo designis TaxID=312471 RepID=A0A7S1KWB1_NEODS
MVFNFSSEGAKSSSELYRMLRSAAGDQCAPLSSLDCKTLMRAMDDVGTPAHHAAKHGDKAVLRYLAHSNHGRTLLTMRRTNDGATIAHEAAANGHTALLQWMLSRGGEL